MLTLLWKVGDTYHLCGEGAETSTYASLSGDYLSLFLPIFDAREGAWFVIEKKAGEDSCQRDDSADIRRALRRRGLLSDLDDEADDGRFGP